VQFNIPEIEFAKVATVWLIIMMRHIFFTEQQNLEAEIGPFKS
jgi:hypothetical protein